MDSAEGSPERPQRQYGESLADEDAYIQAPHPGVIGGGIRHARQYIERPVEGGALRDRRAEA